MRRQYLREILTFLFYLIKFQLLPQQSFDIHPVFPIRNQSNTYPLHRVSLAPSPEPSIQMGYFFLFSPRTQYGRKAFLCDR